MGIISTGKGVARVKPKLVKRTQYIPRLCGLRTKLLGKGTGREKARVPSEHKENPL